MTAKRFEGRIALVTGAAKGLGAAIASALARQGARVFLADVDLAAAEATARALRDEGTEASALALDVADEAAWNRAVASIDSQAGALHVLVNNAGIIARHNIQDMPTAVWQRVLDINLTGAFLGMRLTAPLIARSGGGAMVNISSIAGLAAHPDPAYVASKWGLRGLTKTAALEFAASGIRVNSVHPAMIMTELQLSAPRGYAEASNLAIPLGRAAEAEEVAAAAEAKAQSIETAHRGEGTRRGRRRGAVVGWGLALVVVVAFLIGVAASIPSVPLIEVKSPWLYVVWACLGVFVLSIIGTALKGITILDIRSHVSTRIEERICERGNRKLDALHARATNNS